jgi:hypothetical protein
MKSTLFFVSILCLTIFTACKKDGSFIPSNNSNSQAQNTSAITAPSKTSWGGGSKSTVTYYESDPPEYNCPTPNGNCLGVVVVHGGGCLTNHFITPEAIKSYFTGSDWKININNNLQNDVENLQFLQSGNAHSLILDLSDRSVIFIGDENVSESSYKIVIPIMK